MLETKSATFTFVKQGIYYFSRRVPSDLSHHYATDRICYSLRTKSASVAHSRAARAAQKLDEHWYHLRLRDVELPGQHLLRSDLQKPTAGSTEDSTTGAVKLSEAVSLYLSLKGRDRPATFHRAAQRSCGYVIDVCGDEDRQRPCMPACRQTALPLTKRFYLVPPFGFGCGRSGDRDPS